MLYSNHWRQSVEPNSTNPRCHDVSTEVGPRTVARRPPAPIDCCRDPVHSLSLARNAVHTLQPVSVD